MFVVLTRSTSVTSTSPGVVPGPRRLLYSCRLMTRHVPVPEKDEEGGMSQSSR